MMTDRTLPVEAFAASQITTAWLRRVLAAGGLSNAPVVDFTVAAVGTGQAATSCRITLEYDGDSTGLPATLIAKFPSDDELARTTAALRGTYLREVRFYRDLQPWISIRTPQCYFAEINDPGPAFAVVLEDLFPADQGDQLAGCDVEFARAALRELVGLHAPTWRDRSILDLPWVNSDYPNLPAILAKVYQDGLPQFMARCAPGLAPDELAFLERLGRVDEYPCFPARKSYCVVHNDFRLDNFLYVPSSNVDTVHIVDWQTYGSGNPMTDVAYFLGGCLLPEVRAEVEADLVINYHCWLTENDVHGYSLDECWEDYRRGSYHGLMYAMAGMTNVAASDRGDELFKTMAQRHTRQILDLAADDFID